MSKLIISAFLVITLISVYFFNQNTDDRTETKSIDHDIQEQNKSIPTQTNIVQNNTDSKPLQTRPKEEHKNKVKILSEDATNAYRKALDIGWSSIVDDFETGMIDKSNMSESEKIKLCDLTITKVSKNDLIRLLNANCKPTGSYVSNLIINIPLRDNKENMNEREIIAKLELLRNMGMLQLKNTLDQNLEQDKHGKVDISLYDIAVSRGLNEVIDYVYSIGSSPSTRKNPILTQLTGTPSVTTVKKLLDMGYTPDQNTINYINASHFKDKHPDIYELLN